MKANDPILEFSDVSIAATAQEHSGLSHAGARFGPGTLTIIQVEPGNEQLPLADLASGLISPDQGRVFFRGQAWDAMTPEQALASRARIGRVFDGHGWISNLNVNENITLAQRHHTRRPVAEIMAEARELARGFGLNELPDVRPDLVAPRDLRRCEWVRAFLGQPMLIILERPMRGVALKYLPLLFGAAQDACRQNSAVLWLTDVNVPESREQTARHPQPPPAEQYAMQGLNLVKTG